MVFNGNRPYIHSTTILCDYTHLTSENIQFCMLVIFHTSFTLISSEINFSEDEEYRFQWG